MVPSTIRSAAALAGQPLERRRSVEGAVGRLRHGVRIGLLTLLTAPLLCSIGCRSGDSETVEPAPPEPASASVEPAEFEVGADDLLAARLPADEAAAGWVRLFDGHTLFGWDMAGTANWRVEQGAIVVDAGGPSLLCTSVPWYQFELTLEFKAAADTNSGVFLRTPLQPEDPATDCYEVNIAPPDNPFPLGSLVARERADPPPSTPAADQWQTMRILVEGAQVEVTLNGMPVCEYTDPSPLPTGRIGLQHNQGRIEFRNIRLRPAGLESLLGSELSRWTKYPQMPGEFSVTDEGWLRVQGGRTQLESRDQFDDFVLLAEYKLATAEMNSGIFFRCIPGAEMMGYECQLSHAMQQGDPLQPADCGSGGFFRRQDARIIAGDADQWATLLLVAAGPSMAAWVNGLPVSNWFDDRQPDENPRKGLRLDAGTLMIQGHDPTTDVLLRQLKITELR